MMFAMVECLELKNIERVNKMNMKEHVDRLLVVSTYTKTVLILVAVQISLTFVIIMLTSLLRENVQNNWQLISPIIAGLFLLIAIVIAILVAFAKKINENYPLNVALAVVFSFCMATAFGVLDTQLDAFHRLAIFGISLVLFTCALLIGAAIKTDLADRLTSILIPILVISVLILTVAVVLNLWNEYKKPTIGVFIGAQISLFIITVFISYVTVGKSRYYLFYPNYSLAAILLYIMFFSNLLVNTDIKMVYNRTESCIFQFDAQIDMNIS
ncbi:unnamed protein product [Schistosoma spindalis]|nr:unnamed protein product [Schistosoma spindale]